jgi:uncharacterized protein YebE (UPF0316 family)
MSLLADLSFSTFPLLPILVFFAELCVVTLCTLRIIFLSRGMKILPPLIGFFEVTTWLFAIGKVMQNLSDPGCFLGFACGFTLGNFFGVLIEQALALGHVVVRTITHKDATDLVESLRLAHFGVTSLAADGARGPVKMIFTVVRRKELEAVLVLIRRFDPDAFYSVDEIQEAGPGIFRQRKRVRGILPSLLHSFRKAA